MKRGAVVILAAAIALAWPGPLRSEKTAGVDLPRIHSFNASGGLVVYYVKDELPKTTVIAMARFGRLYETRENAGISDLLAKAMSVGGSRKYPGQLLHDRIDSLGGRLAISGSWEDTVITVKVLDRFSDEAFDIIADLLVNPALDDASIETARALVIDDIKRRDDDPADAAFVKLRELVFGGTGYGARPSEKSVRSITAADIRAAHARYFVSGNIMAGVTSRADIEAVQKSASRAFAAVRPGKPIDYPVDDAWVRSVIAGAKGKVYLFPKEIPQATIVIGTLAPPVRDRSSYSLALMNYILGGGSFNSRLMDSIRVKRGLAYAVQSIVRQRRDTGMFIAFAQTENKSAGEVLRLLRENIETMAQMPPSREELEWARNSIAASYIFNFDTPANVVEGALYIRLNKLDDRYYDEYIERLSAVKLSDLPAATSKMLEGGTVVLVVGSTSLVPDLKKYGEVVVLDH